MQQTIFLDSNIILDYLENRNREVREILSELLKLHKEGKCALTTSVFNIAEIIDKEFEINFYGWCLTEKMSYDEIVNKIFRDSKKYKEISDKKA